jgi:hypothetical protein
VCSRVCSNLFGNLRSTQLLSLRISGSVKRQKLVLCVAGRFGFELVQNRSVTQHFSSCKSVNRQQTSHFSGTHPDSYW